MHRSSRASRGFGKYWNKDSKIRPFLFWVRGGRWDFMDNVRIWEFVSPVLVIELLFDLLCLTIFEVLVKEICFG